MKNAGPILRDAMHKAGISGRQLAAQTGIPHSTISRVLSGKLHVGSPETVDKLASALDIDTDALYLGDGRLPPDVVQAVIRYPSLIQTIRNHARIIDAGRASTASRTAQARRIELQISKAKSEGRPTTTLEYFLQELRKQETATD